MEIEQTSTILTNLVNEADLVHIVSTNISVQVVTAILAHVRTVLQQDDRLPEEDRFLLVT